MKAFIGRSFDEHDNQLITKIVEFIESLDINCGDAKSAKNKTVEEKITELIEGCEIFVGIFTCDKPICKEEKKTKWHCKPRSETTIFTTSNWVIQESGFALGRNKKLILLKENGVCELPKLQGNLEYIPFDRNHLEDSFLKISQMISDIKAKAIGGVTEKSSEGLSKAEETKTEEHKEQPKEEVKNKRDELFRKVYLALLRDKDYKKAWEIYDKEAESVFDEDDKSYLHAYILKVSPSLGDENAHKKLEKLAQEKKDYPRVIKQLAYRYKEIGEFKRAREQFLLAAEKYDINVADKRIGLVNAYIQAAWCLVLDGNLNESINELNGLLLNPNLQESRAEIFEAMARISKEKGPVEDFLIFAEASLDIDPVNTQLRFELAYAYSNNNNEKLALLHYKKLTDTTKHISGLNNIGVSYGRLEIKGKSIKSYFNAAEEKETLAMSNLANRYIDAGFIDQAQELINEAYDLHKDGFEVDSRVGEAQKRIKTMAEEENKKEEEILLEAKKESQYRVKCSNALCSDKKLSKTQVEDTWQTSWGSMQLKYNEENNSFEVEHKRKAEITSYYSHGEKFYKDEVIKIKGTIRNLSGRYTIEVSDEKTATSLLTSGNIYRASGYMIINENCDFIEIMENTYDGKTKFEQWKKNPASTVEATT
jgi:tetratricopeptide (TPR) repeat protein